MKTKKQRGFTLIEILVVIGIMAVLATSAGFIYGNFQVSAQLNESSSQIIQTMRTARERSVSRVNDSEHGVKFQPNSYILYQGTSYTLRDSAYDREIVLDSSMSISTTLISDEVNFFKGLGVPDNTGNVTLTNEVSGNRVISVNSFGLVEEE